MSVEKECFVCKTMSNNKYDKNSYLSFFDCPICGMYVRPDYADKPWVNVIVRKSVAN